MKNLKSGRIVVTSLGVCHNLGLSNEEFKENLLNSSLDNQSILKIKDDKLELELEKYVDERELRRIDRVSKIGLLSSQVCFANSKLNLEGLKDDIGVVICTTYGAVASSRDFINSAVQMGVKNASPLIFPYSVPNAATGIITILLGIRGFNTTISGFNPVCYAYDLLKLKKAHAFLVGGLEEITHEITSANKSRVDLSSNSSTDAYIKPISEGSAVVMMTTMEFAELKGLDVLFEISSYGMNTNLSREHNSIDNFGYIYPLFIYKTMTDAISKGNAEKENIKMIVSLAGNHSRQKDSELQAIRDIWGNSYPEVNYIKDVIGETFGSSDTFSIISSYFHSLNNNHNDGFILVNSYQIGGNISSVLIKIL